jgi:GNAT superfamily N-acetyltransferase
MVAELSGELGYPVAVSTMEARVRDLIADTDHVVFVACDGDAVVGWIHASIAFHLQTGAGGEIGGLVVSQAYRGSGIGGRLVSRAEEWVRGRGLTRVVVRSRINREGAHRFYLRAGYERTKTSAVFSKTLV